jgi:hypothetical protein
MYEGRSPGVLCGCVCVYTVHGLFCGEVCVLKPFVSEKGLAVLARVEEREHRRDILTTLL